MPEDPIVAEVRERRAELLQTAGGTLDALIQFLKERETEAGRVSVRRASQTTTPKSRAV